MDVSVIIISYNTRALLRECLLSVFTRTLEVDFEVFVVDNASVDGSCEMVRREFPKVQLIENDKNNGFAEANNQAMRLAKGEYLLLLNSDTVLQNNAIKILHNFMVKHPRVGLCGPLLLNADKTVQQSIEEHHTVVSLILRLLLGAHRGLYLRLLGDKYRLGAFDYTAVAKISNGWMTGAVLMIRSMVREKTGLLDESYHFMMEDADFCLAVHRAGWETWFVPEAVVVHLLGGSRNSQSEHQEIVLKVHSLRQYRYYVRKNLGLPGSQVFFVLTLGIFAANLFKRVLSVVFSARADRSRAVFKTRLALCMIYFLLGLKYDRLVEGLR